MHPRVEGLQLSVSRGDGVGPPRVHGKAGRLETTAATGGNVASCRRMPRR